MSGTHVSRLLATAVVAVLATVATAEAATYKISLFNSRVPDVFAGDDPATFDYQNDGIADGVGTFTADAGGGLLSSISLTLGAVTFDGIQPPFGLSMGTNFGTLARFLQGYAFKPGETPSSNSGALQLGAIGMALGSGPMYYFGTWNFATCAAFSCGGGAYRGVYQIEEMAAVPLPASVPLLAGGLAMLAALARRRRT